MSNDVETRYSITCDSCGKVNAFSLFNPATIAANDLVHCSHCRFPMCRWRDLKGRQEEAAPAAAHSAAAAQDGAAAAPASPPPHSELH